MLNVNEAIATLKENGLVFKVVKVLQDYLSCEVRFFDNKKPAW